MDVDKFKQGFIEGVYKSVSEMTPEQREQVKQGKDVVLDFIGAVGAFVDVADEYVDKAIEFVEGLYVDVKDDTAPKAAVQPKADSSTLDSIYRYLYSVENNAYYWKTMEFHGYRYNDEAAKGLVNLYNELVVNLDDVSDIAYRNSQGLSNEGYSL